MTKGSTTTPPRALSRVRQIDVPPKTRALSTLAHIGYEDAFLVNVGPVSERTAEEWARAVLEEAPKPVRRSLYSGWSAIGLKVARGHSEDSVLGWTVRRRARDSVVLGADSLVGMPAELLISRQEEALLFCTFVQQDNPVARAMWKGIEPLHVPIVRHLLEQASRRFVT